MDEKEMTVYKHTSPDGKVYIGITKSDPERRFNGGNGYKGNEIFYKDIQKHGWDAFTHEILAVGLSVEEACFMEIELIREYDSTNPDKGYNMQDGGMYMRAERRMKKAEKERQDEFTAKMRGFMRRQLTEYDEKVISDFTEIADLINAIDDEIMDERCALRYDELSTLLKFVYLRIYKKRGIYREHINRIKRGDSDAES